MMSHFHRLPHSFATAIAVVALIATAGAQQKKQTPPASDFIELMPKLLPLREQTAVRERWLKTRLDTMLLPMMRRHGVSMWIITTEEFHPDTIAEYVAPPIPYVGRRDFFIFTDRGADRLERIASERNMRSDLSPPRR